MTIGIDNDLRSAFVDAIRDAIDFDASAGVLAIYNGARPPKGGSITTELASFTLPDPVAPNATSGVSTWNVVAPSTIGATGTATWFRVTDGAGAFVFDGDVATSGADLNFDSDSFISGRSITIDSFVITAGNL